MSRTIRRRKGDQIRHQPVEYRSEKSRYGGQFIVRQKLKVGDPGYGRAYWRTHRDNQRGLYTAPWVWRNLLHRRCRRRERMIIISALQQGNLDVVLSARKRDAGWHWF